MTTTTVEQELLNLEERYWRSIKDKDADAAMRLTDESCIITGAQGIARVDRQALADLMENASYTLNDFTLKDAQVRPGVRAVGSAPCTPSRSWATPWAAIGAPRADRLETLTTVARQPRPTATRSPASSR
jgi:hypothetical protein